MPARALSASAPTELRAVGCALRRRVVDDVVEPLIERGDELVALRAGQKPVLDSLVEVLDGLGLDRRLQAVDGLAAGPLRVARQRLPGAQLFVQLLLGEPEVVRRALECPHAVPDPDPDPGAARPATSARPAGA